jgi:hypothetical protein
MQKIQHTTRRNNIFLTLAVFAIMTILLGASCTGAAESFSGEWFGASGQSGDGPAVTLTIEDTKSNIHYGSPRNCQIDFERPTLHTDTQFKAAVDNSNGGWCDRLFNGHILVKKSGDKVTYTLSDENKKVLDQGTLKLSH